MSSRRWLVPLPLAATWCLVVVLAAMWPKPVLADSCPAGGEHEYEAELVTPASDTAEGVRRFTCAKCGDSFEQTIPATGHVWGPWTTDVEPTCTSQGHQYRECVQHGGTPHREERVVPALSPTGEHAWTEVAREAPTCEQAGTSYLRCAVCGAEKTERVPAMGHDWSAWSVVEPATHEAEGRERRVCAHDPSHVEQRPLARLESQPEEPGLGSQPEPQPQQEPQPQPQPELQSHEGLPAVDAPLPAPEPEAPAPAPAAVDQWAPNALDAALLVVDTLSVAAFGLAAAPLVHARRWIVAHRREAARASLRPRGNNEGGRVL